MNNSIIQIILIQGYDAMPSPAVFDQHGKTACVFFFDNLFKRMYKEMYLYYKEMNFTFKPRPEPYTYNEYFYKQVENKIIPAADFSECDFYERSFYTADRDYEDTGIVPVITYSFINSGEILKIVSK
jgi:hypothetical protein